LCFLETCGPFFKLKTTPKYMILQCIMQYICADFMPAFLEWTHILMYLNKLDAFENFNVRTVVILYIFASQVTH